jgi:hypothetical protein
VCVHALLNRGVDNFTVPSEQKQCPHGPTHINREGQASARGVAIKVEMHPLALQRVAQGGINQLKTCQCVSCVGG